jgi:uncharacterized protein
MRIELDKLVSRESSFAHEYEPDEFELEDEVRLAKTLKIEGTLHKSDTQVELKGKIKTVAEVACDRCLSKVIVPVESEFDALYVPETFYRDASNHELNEEEMNVATFDGQTIDVDELAHEQFYLALPDRNLCKEDCLGLCPKCAINKNTESCSCEEKEIDPRWAALKDLKF